jgi:S-adenosyl methyltransferase
MCRQPRRAGGAIVASTVYAAEKNGSDEVARFFGGLEAIEPGVVQPQQWRPDLATEIPAEVTAWCGVALKS